MPAACRWPALCRAASPLISASTLPLASTLAGVAPLISTAVGFKNPLCAHTIAVSFSPSGLYSDLAPQAKTAMTSNPAFLGPLYLRTYDENGAVTLNVMLDSPPTDGDISDSDHDDWQPHDLWQRPISRSPSPVSPLSVDSALLLEAEQYVRDEQGFLNAMLDLRDAPDLTCLETTSLDGTDSNPSPPDPAGEATDAADGGGTEIHTTDVSAIFMVHDRSRVTVVVPPNNYYCLNCCSDESDVEPSSTDRDQDQLLGVWLPPETERVDPVPDTERPGPSGPIRRRTRPRIVPRHLRARPRRRTTGIFSGVQFISDSD